MSRVLTWIVGASAAGALMASTGSALAQTPADFDPARELLRIARAKSNETLLASFAAGKGVSTPNLTEATLQPIIDTVEKVGHPERVVQMLEARIRRFPHELDARVALAKFHVRAGNSKAAIPVWEETKRRFGLKTPHVVLYARVLSSVGDQPAALKQLKEARAAAPPEARDFWSDLAVAAWENDDAAEATVAYRQLFKMSTAPAASTPAAPPDEGATPVAQVSSRLMQLLADAGAIDEALVVAKEALVRERNPAHLLFVTRLLVKQKQLEVARRTLELADQQRALVSATLDYWVLKAEVLSQLGDKEGARRAYRTALQIDPAAPGARAALLWDSIDRNDLRTLALDLRSWAKDVAGDHDLVAPTAIGLDRIGRTRAALPFYLRQLREAPADFLWAMEFSDALARAGQETQASRLRRRAFAQLRTASATALAPDKRDQKLLEMHALLTRELRGEPEAERWLQRVYATGKPSAELEEFAVAWYLSDERFDRARRHLARAHVLRLQRGSLRKPRLALAMADDDRVEIEHLLESTHDLTDAELASAYLRIERDDRAVAPIMSQIDRLDVTGESPASGAGGAAPSSDARTLRHELRAIAERTDPYVGGGGLFSLVDNLSAAGPTALASHRLRDGRLHYGASALRLDDLGASSVAVAGLVEGDATVLARFVRPRRVTEIGGGLLYLSGLQPEVPLPHLSYLEVIQLTRKVTFSAELGLHRRIEDTSFLRVAALRDVVSFDLAIEPMRRTYLLLGALGQEDHTRTFKPLAVEGGGSIEAGVKLLERVPELTVGARGAAYVRSKPPDVPSEYADIVKRGEGPDALFPPSFQTLLVTARVARGDFFERARQDLVPFPRYDCSVDAGYLFGQTSAATPGAPASAERGPAFAAGAHCAVSLRMPGGYVSGIGEFIKGVRGIAEADNARAALSYTFFLR